MYGYLGEFDVSIEDTPYGNYKPTDWAMYYIERYGQIDGDHHKQWVLDTVARILKGAPISIKVAKWDNGHSEYRVQVGSCKLYEDWVEQMLERDESGEPTYSYDKGIPP